MSIRFLTSGESHGKCLNVIIEGFPSGVSIDENFINEELKRRQGGYGRGKRMKIEADTAEVKSGIRHGISIGSPICIEIKNKDYENWQISMASSPVDLNEENIVKEILSKKITKLRPGHADFAGAVKYGFNDIRNVLERSSARETAARVAVGALCKLFLKQFDIEGFSHVSQISEIIADNSNKDYEAILQFSKNSELNCADTGAEFKMKSLIDEAKEKGISLGGKIEVVFKNLPVGLGSYVHWDKRLDGLLAQALMSIPAVKSVEIGLGSKVANLSGDKVHDEIFYENNKIIRKTNNAGGIEGGMTNGEALVISIAMKPIPTMKNPLQSIDFETKENYQAHFERSDVCAVPACGVVAESMCAFVLMNEFLNKFGADNLHEIKTNFDNRLDI